jgi:hypothetical protein
MIDLDKLAIDLYEIADPETEEITQARVSVMVQSDEGRVVENVYTIQYYEDRDGRPDYQWAVSFNPISR